MQSVRRRFLFRKAIRRLLKKEIVPGRLLLIGVLLGSLIGLVCVAFQILPDLFTEYRLNYFVSHELDLLILLLIFVSSGLMAAFALYITMRFAPEAGGSGIPEIEGALEHKRPVRWWRVLPVKLLGGVASLGSGMVLGREGPSIQIGGNLGKMVADLCLIPRAHAMTLLASGGAAGLAAAFNAPLAGILFVLEELRPQFRYSFLSIQLVSVTVVSATIIRCLVLGQDAVFAGLPMFETPKLSSYICFIILGLMAGCLGVLFNRLVEVFQNLYLRYHQGIALRAVPLIFMVGGTFGLIAVFYPEASGSGMHSIPNWIVQHSLTLPLLLLLLLRVIGILICFCSGIPGGIFAPSLAIGTILGALLGAFLDHCAFTWTPDSGVLAITGMCAFFAASVRAPVTGIVLATEMTNNYQFILPMMTATLVASIVAQKLGGKPIYAQILERTLRLEQAKSIKAKE